MEFRKIQFTDEDLDFFRDVLKNGDLVTGPYIWYVESLMRFRSMARLTVAVSSCTDALKIALRGLGLGPGSKFLVPDITFVASASAGVELGAEPVFCDVHKDDFLFDYDSFMESVKGVDAIVAVSLNGEQLPDWVFSAGVPVVVDSAHAIQKHEPRAYVTCYSFHASKMVPGVDGGVIATGDFDLHKFASKARYFGLDGRRPDFYGYKANMTNLSAAVISRGLEKFDDIKSKREIVRDIYNKAFGLDRRGLGGYMVLVNDPDKDFGVPVIRHYPEPLSRGVNENAKFVADHLISLPFHEYLSTEEIQLVCDTIKPELI